jgi:hypothetical protein
VVSTGFLLRIIPVHIKESAAHICDPVTSRPSSPRLSLLPHIQPSLFKLTIYILGAYSAPLPPSHSLAQQPPGAIGPFSFLLSLVVSHSCYQLRFSRHCFPRPPIGLVLVVAASLVITLLHFKLFCWLGSASYSFASAKIIWPDKFQYSVHSRIKRRKYTIDVGLTNESSKYIAHYAST